MFLKSFLLIAIFSFVSACSKPPEGVLTPLSGATAVEQHHVRGMDVVEYNLQVKYPAREKIQQVKQRLEQSGYKPLPYVYLYPKTQSSHVLGWTYFNDPPRNPEWVIYEWTCDWLDPQGNLVTYTFRYKDPYAKYQKSTFILAPAQKEMSVTAIYTPAGVAKHKQKSLNPDL